MKYDEGRAYMYVLAVQGGEVFESLDTGPL